MENALIESWSEQKVTDALFREIEFSVGAPTEELRLGHLDRAKVLLEELCARSRRELAGG